MIALDKDTIKKALATIESGEEIVVNYALKKGHQFIYIDHDEVGLLIVAKSNGFLGFIPWVAVHEVYFTSIKVNIDSVNL